MKIKNFHGRESEELRYDKGFEENCILLASHSNKAIKDHTVREYFALIRYVNNQNKKQRAGPQK